MPWNQVAGHEQVIERLRRAFAARRLRGTLLFVGPEGVGKRLVALHLARVLLCEGRRPEAFESCEACTACAQVAALSHPDVNVVEKPVDRSSIPLDLLTGEDGFCYRVFLRPMRGRGKVAILDDADYLQAEGANALLKTLEEPPANTLLILIATREQRLLPTIRSRAQVLRFAPLPAEVVAQLLLERELTSSAEDARQAAELAQGSMTRGARLLDSSWRQFVNDFRLGLKNVARESIVLARLVAEHVENSGEDARAKRACLAQVADFAAEHYCSLLAIADGAEAAANGLPAAVGAGGLAAGELAAECLERTLAVYPQIEGNVQLPAIVDAWIDDLHLLCRTGTAASCVRPG